jgi:hypothetical protein
MKNNKEQKNKNENTHMLAISNVLLRVCIDKKSRKEAGRGEGFVRKGGGNIRRLPFLSWN